jgi:hypothetical protein
LRVLRGASWYDGAGRCRSANRDSAPSSRCTNNIGFRVIAAPGEAVPSEAKTGDDAAVKGNP